MTSSIMPLLATPSTTLSSQITMASAQSHISTTSAPTLPSHLTILSIKGFVLPSDNYSDISRQALSSESQIKLVYFYINDTKQIVCRVYCFILLILILNSPKILMEMFFTVTWILVSVERNGSFWNGVEKWCNAGAWEVAKQFKKSFPILSTIKAVCDLTNGMLLHVSHQELWPSLTAPSRITDIPDSSVMSTFQP